MKAMPNPSSGKSIALPMAEAIRTVMQSQALTETETSQLMGVLAKIVGMRGLRRRMLDRLWRV